MLEDWLHRALPAAELGYMLFNILAMLIGSLCVIIARCKSREARWNLFCSYTIAKVFFDYLQELWEIYVYSHGSR